MTGKRPTARAVAQRLNRIELDHLRELVQVQHGEIIDLRERLDWAEQAAESWRDDAMRMMEEACSDGSREPGMTISGALVTVPVRSGD